MLHDFLTANRHELISRCRAKVARRFQPSETPSAVDSGAPVLLQQLADTLRGEQLTDEREVAFTQAAPAPTEIGRAAAFHGAELLRFGYTIDQVVHDYGDVCQAITELAVERRAEISVDEFRTLNRCLDNAIADAVASFGSARQSLVDSQATTLHDRLNNFTAEHRRLVEIAIQSFSAIKAGNVALTGATVALLQHTLSELHTLAERSLPQLHLLSEATTVTSR